MQTITMTIDTVYEAVIKLSVSFVERCIDLYSTTPRMNSVQNIVSEPTVEEILETEVEKTTFKPVSDILERSIVIGAQKNTIMYALVAKVPVYKNPTIEFDTQIGEIPYGDMVIVLEPKGRFYHIMWNTTEGWVLRDDIADRSLRVHPVFLVGEENSIDHPNTAHVRTILGDVFGLGRSEFPLQAGEYVLYRLWKKGIKINWPDVRPRVPGLWHRILRGVSSVHMGVTPKVGAVMEYMVTNEIGHLAYVEAVFPDEAITISEVNYPDSGIYNERVLPKNKWKEMKPIFIEAQ